MSLIIKPGDPTIMKKILLILTGSIFVISAYAQG